MILLTLEPNEALAYGIGAEIVLVLWFIINALVSRHRSIMDKLFRGPIYEFPNPPTFFLLFFNGGIAFIILVAFIQNLLS